MGIDGNLARVWEILYEQSTKGLVRKPAKGRALVAVGVGEAEPHRPMLKGKSFLGKNGHKKNEDSESKPHDTTLTMK